ALARSDGGRAIVEVATRVYFSHPSPQLKAFRLAALLLYAELEPLFDEAFLGFSQPPGTLGKACRLNCSLITDDALIGCFSAGGTRLRPILLMGRPPSGCEVRGEDVPLSHEPLDCYGGCGKGCSFCETVRYGCTDGAISWDATPPVDGSRGESTPTPCYDEATSDPAALPKDRFVSNSACASQRRPAGTYQVCTTKTACYEHDECTGHDSNPEDVALCHARGRAGCGSLACAIGRPPPPFDYKWFNELGAPLNVGPTVQPPAPGTCTWTARCASGTCVPSADTWIAAGLSIPHDPDEHAVCLVHGCKHHGDTDRCDTCTPRTCADFASQGCGTYADGCGGTLQCGERKHCGSGANGLNKRCGTYPDGCGGQIVCGPACTGYELTIVVNGKGKVTERNSGAFAQCDGRRTITLPFDSELSFYTEADCGNAQRSASCTDNIHYSATGFILKGDGSCTWTFTTHPPNEDCTPLCGG
ncbi:MAG: hypothetical protein ACK4N5_17590, partial [Myxococcales bacterium]